MAGFNKEDYIKLREKKTKEIKFTAPLGWINETFLPVHGVPLNIGRVKDLANAKFPKPTRLEGITVAVPGGEVEYNPMDCKGSWKLASPVEPVHAQYFAVDRDIGLVKNNKLKQNVLDEWAVILKSTVVTMVICEDDVEIMFRQDNQREDYVKIGMAVDLTGLQRVMKANVSKGIIETKYGEFNMSATRFAQILNDNVDLAPSSEPMSDNFIKQSSSVFQKGLRHQQIFNIVEYMDSRARDSPFFRVSVMYVMFNKLSSTKETIELCESIVFHDRMQHTDAGSYSLDRVQPKNGKKGILDVLIAKMRSRDYLIHTFLNELEIPAEIKLEIRKIWEAIPVILRWSRTTQGSRSLTSSG